MKRLSAVLLGAVAVLSGCGSGSGSAPGAPSTGTVSGVFETIGGPVGYGPHRLPGTVVFTDDRGSRTAVTVATNGSFRVDLAPGAYTAVGRSPRVHSDGEEMSCHPLKPLEVRSRSVVSVTIACPIM